MAHIFVFVYFLHFKCLTEVWEGAVSLYIEHLTQSGDYKTFFVLNSLSMKVHLLIKGKMVEYKDFSYFKTLRCCIY